MSYGLERVRKLNYGYVRACECVCADSCCTLCNLVDTAFTCIYDKLVACGNYSVERTVNNDYVIVDVECEDVCKIRVIVEVNLFYVSKHRNITVCEGVVSDVLEGGCNHNLKACESFLHECGSTDVLCCTEISLCKCCVREGVVANVSNLIKILYVYELFTVSECAFKHFATVCVKNNGLKVCTSCECVLANCFNAGEVDCLDCSFYKCIFANNLCATNAYALEVSTEVKCSCRNFCNSATECNRFKILTECECIFANVSSRIKLYVCKLRSIVIENVFFVLNDFRTGSSVFCTPLVEYVAGECVSANVCCRAKTCTIKCFKTCCAEECFVADSCTLTKSNFLECGCCVECAVTDNCVVTDSKLSHGRYECNYVNLLTVFVSFCFSYNLVCVRREVEHKCICADIYVVTDSNTCKVVAVSECTLTNLCAVVNNYACNIGACECVFADFLNTAKVGCRRNSCVIEAVFTDGSNLAKFNCLDILTVSKCVLANLCYTGKLNACEIEVACECACANLCDGAICYECTLCCGSNEKNYVTFLICKVVILRNERSVSFLYYKGLSCSILECVLTDNVYVATESNLLKCLTTVECACGNNRCVNVDFLKCLAVCKYVLTKLNLFCVDCYLFKLYTVSKCVSRDGLCIFGKNNLLEVSVILERIVCNSGSLTKGNLTLEVTVFKCALVDELNVFDTNNLFKRDTVSKCAVVNLFKS